MAKLTLHIGLGKTGTTSIQDFFSANRSELLRQGVLYPNFSNSPNHHALVTAFEHNPKALPRAFHRYDQGTIQQLGNQILQLLTDQIKKHRADDWILSTEYFIHITNHETVSSIHRYFSRFFDEIEVICFVREPVGYYASLAQQHLQGNTSFPGPDSFKMNVRDVLELWSKYFKVSVYAHTLEKDSVATLSSHLRLDTRGWFRPAQNNVSLSTEQIYLLCDLQRHLNSPEDNLFTSQNDQYKTLVATILMNPPPATFSHKPEIIKSVRTLIWSNHRADFDWINKTFGTTFDIPKQNLRPSTEAKTLSGDFKSFTSIFVTDLDSIALYKAFIFDYFLSKMLNGPEGNTSQNRVQPPIDSIKQAHVA